MSTAYEQSREHYWEMQRKFRYRAIAEMERLIPEGVAAVLLDFNDSDPPRLAVAGYLDEHGVKLDADEFEPDADADEGETLYDQLDHLASDMEFADWDEAKSYLFRTEDGMYFRVERRPPQRRVEVIMERHITERRHSTWTAIVPADWLENRTYFTEEGYATPAFDRWITSEGTESDVQFSSDGRADADEHDHEFDDLNYDVVAVTDVNAEGQPGADTPLEGTDQ